MMTDPEIVTGKQTFFRWEPFCFYAAAVAVLFHALGVNPLWGSEDRWAEIARQMLMTGDLFHPVINGVVYFDKPLLSYWMIVFCSRHLTGGLGEFTVRLPSALTALAALWAVRDLAKRFSFSREAVAYSGWILLSSYAFLFWGRTAAAELPNLAAVVLAMDWFFRRREKRCFLTYFVFFFICFSGALTKGLPALVIPCLLALLFLGITGRWKEHFNVSAFAAFFCGVALFFASFLIAAKLPLPPGIVPPRGNLSGLELVWQENIVRVFRPFDHDEGIFCYVINVPRIMLPWTLLLITALLSDLIHWKKRDLFCRYLWLASLLIFLLFSASGSRRWYYILPIMPFLSLSMGRFLTETDRWSEWTLRIYRWLFTALAVLALIGAAVLLPLWKYSAFFAGFPPVPFAFCAIFPALLAVLWLMRKKGPVRILAAGVILTGTVFSILQPAAGIWRTEKPFYLAIRAACPAAEPEDFVCFAEKRPGKFLFYGEWKRPVPMVNNDGELRALLASSRPPRYLLATDRPSHLAALKKLCPGVDWEHPLVSEARIPRLEDGNVRKLHLWRLPEK